MPLVRLVSATCFTLLASAMAMPLAATDGWMGDSDLSAAFKAKTVNGHYKNGDRFTETYAVDGSVAYRDDGRESGGHWSVESGTFCTIYDDDPAGGCFRVKRAGSNCYEFYFVARTEAEASQGRTKKPDWVAQAWFKDQVSTCVAGADV